MKRVAAFALLSLALAAARADDQAAPAPQRDELGARQYVLNDLFVKYAKTNEICYVAFGSEIDAQTKKRGYIDPPEGFLDRCSKRRYQVKPASALPKTDGYRREKNPRTGAPDGVYVVEIVQWISDTRVKIRGSYRRAAMWAAGYEVEVEIRDGQWRIVKSGAQWVS